VPAVDSAERPGVQAWRFVKSLDSSGVLGREAARVLWWHWGAWLGSEHLSLDSFGAPWRFSR
jgi:hypothetical protein